MFIEVKIIANGEQKLKNMIKDEFGYITGRGLSKYWGVSKQQLQVGGKDPWVVKFADPYIAAGKANRYRLFTAIDFTLSELDAAIVGAYFHANPMPFCNYPPRITFKSANGKYTILVDTRGKHIYKKKDIDITKQAEEQAEETIQYWRSKQLAQLENLFKEIVVESEKPVVQTEESAYDSGFAAGFALREIIERRLGAKNLKSILKTVEERLSKGEK